MTQRKLKAATCLERQKRNSKQHSIFEKRDHHLRSFSWYWSHFYLPLLKALAAGGQLCTLLLALYCVKNFLTFMVHLRSWRRTPLCLIQDIQGFFSSCMSKNLSMANQNNFGRNIHTSFYKIDDYVQSEENFRGKTLVSGLIQVHFETK